MPTDAWAAAAEAARIVRPTADLADQLPLYEQAQQMLVDDAPAAWIYWYGRFTLVKPYVQGMIVTAGDSNTGELFYDKIYIAPREG